MIGVLISDKIKGEMPLNLTKFHQEQLQKIVIQQIFRKTNQFTYRINFQMLILLEVVSKVQRKVQIEILKKQN